VDLKEGKVTLPLLHALERCDAAEREAIRLGTISASPDTFRQVLEVLKKYGSLDYTMKLAKARVTQTQDSLKDVPDSPYREALFKITEYVTQRRR